MSITSEQALDLAARALSQKRYRHTLGVASLAEELAVRHGLNSGKARVAALLHDLAKEIPVQQQVRLAKRWGLMSYPEDEKTPGVLHGPVAAYWLEHRCGFLDREVLDAVAHHTLGMPGMQPLEMLIYSVDLVEPNRNFPKVDILRRALYDSIEGGTLACLEHTLNYLVQAQKPVHPLTRLTHQDLRRRFKVGT